MTLKERLENSTKLIVTQILNSEKNDKKLSERFVLLKKSLEQTDGEIQKLKIKGISLRDQVVHTEKSIQQTERAHQKEEEAILARKGEQTTASKAARNLVKLSVEVQHRIHEKEVDMSQMENELARIKVDCLNTAAHDKQLRSTLTGLVQELKEKDSLIEKYELEIRQRNDEIEKKMYIVDRLNRKYCPSTL